MPAVISYFLHGQRVLEQNRPLLEHFCQGDFREDVFQMGCQGADIFACHRILPWQKAPQGTLRAWADDFRALDPEQLFSVWKGQVQKGSSHRAWLTAYVSGFLCHDCFARTMEPFLRYGAKMLAQQHPGQKESMWRCQIESSLDSILLRYEKGDLPTSFPLKQAMPNPPEAVPVLAQAYREIAEALWGKTVSPALILQAFSDCRKAFGAWTDRTTLKTWVLQNRERKKQQGPVCSCYFRGLSEAGEYDYANVSNQEWQWPEEDGPVRTESFFDLYESCIQKMPEQFSLFFGEG